MVDTDRSAFWSSTHPHTDTNANTITTLRPYLEKTQSRRRKFVTAPPLPTRASSPTTAVLASAVAFPS